MKTVRLDAYVIDTLMPDLVDHERSPAAFLVYLLLWRHTRGDRRHQAKRSLREIAEGTGLARRTVQGALDRLETRGLVSTRRDGITAVPVYRVNSPWIRRRKAR